MIIIYHCYGGAHSSVLAAAIHTGCLPVSKVPDINEIINLPYYDQTSSSEIGIPYYYGKDECNNKIYIQGMGSSDNIITNMLNSFLKIENIDKREVYLVNTLKNVNILVRLGGFLSRGIGLVMPGRPLTAYGLRLAYPKFVKMVNSVKAQISIA